jgi:hypothetical protein
VRCWIVLLCAVLAWPAYADKLDDRLAGFAKETHLKAWFVESYHASYLDQPVVSQGELEYQAPGLLSKKITVPEAVTYKINGNMMTVQRKDDVMQVDLTTQPELGLGISALRNLLDGNRHGLEMEFSLDYQVAKQDGEWQLVLVPHDKTLRKKVRRVVMHGKGNQLENVQMEYANGDTLLTRITNE